MNRREFLEISSFALLSNLLTLNTIASNNSKVVVWEIAGNPRAAVRELFNALGGITKLTSQDPGRMSVLIKPNLCLPHRADMATTSSPEVIDALCSYLIECGIKKIIIADHTLRDSSYFKDYELNKIVNNQPHVKLVLANEQRLYQPISVPGKVLQSTELLKMLSHVNLFINLATAKHHSATHVSLSLKNLMGLIWNRTEFHNRLDLAQAIADLALVIRPSLNIVDASRVLLNGGPTGPGQVIKDNRLFASFDMVALDALILSNYNFGGKSISAKEVPHLLATYKNHIGEIDIEKIVVNKLQA